LADEGHLRSTEWVEAFAATPRHLFTPEVIITTPNGYRLLSGDNSASRQEWLSAVYSDESLVTQGKPHAAGYLLSSGEPLRVPTGSSSMRSLMARMLEALGIEDGMRILEVGTGTGYNAALLSHRIGEDNVVSIDIDPCLIDQAARRIAQLGYTPTLVAGDGAAGAAEHGPYDRIIATAAVPEIPIAWVQQLKPGGKILANLRGDLAGGTLCLLSKEDDDDGFRFLLQLQLHAAQTLWRGRAFDPVTRSERDAVLATAADGSRAEACTGQEDDGSHRVVQHRVVQTGPRRIWDTIEATFRLWRDIGQPAPEKFGLVANDSTQFAWFGDDDSWHRWPLPLI
jgi:protein-L-isoaspartate O-methyltransferase